MVRKLGGDGDLEDPVAVDDRPILAALVHQHVALLLLVKVNFCMELEQTHSVVRRVSDSCSTIMFDVTQLEAGTLLTPISGILTAWSMSFSL